MLLALIASSACYAQKWEASAFGGYLRTKKNNLGSLNTDQTTSNDNDTNFKGIGYSYGVRLTRNTRGYYGSELGYMRTRVNVRANYPIDVTGNTNLETGPANVDLLFYDFLAYMMPAGEKYRPYLAFGLNGTRFSVPRVPFWDVGSSLGFGFNYGAGMKIRIKPHVLLRADLRQYFTSKPYGNLTVTGTGNIGGHVNILEGSVGIGFAF